MKTTVLVVDDDESIRIIYSEFLRNCGFSVVSAIDGQNAIEKVKENPGIKLVFMDGDMPIMDGWEATKKIKMLRPDLPIVSITTHRFEDIKAKYIEGKFDAFLPKPWNFRGVMETINELIN